MFVGKKQGSRRNRKGHYCMIRRETRHWKKTMQNRFLIQNLSSKFINRSLLIKKLLRQNIESNCNKTAEKDKKRLLFGLKLFLSNALEIPDRKKNRIYKDKDISSDRIKLLDHRIAFTKIHQKKQKIISSPRFYHRNFQHYFFFFKEVKYGQRACKAHSQHLGFLAVHWYLPKRIMQ